MYAEMVMLTEPLSANGIRRGEWLAVMLSFRYMAVRYLSVTLYIRLLISVFEPEYK